MPALDQPAGTAVDVPFAVHPLIDDVFALSGTPASTATITCVDVCGDNLYVGTSDAEVLHFVRTQDGRGPEIYMFASRLQPPAEAGSMGCQQILVLPKEQKACILCNGTLTFYGLPELSPAYGGTSVPNCSWVGGLNEDQDEADGVEVMICVKSRIRLVKISESVQRVRDLQFTNCIQVARYGNFACVADVQGYYLLDIEHQQKVSLFPVSSLDEARESTGTVESMKHHQRSTSLGALGRLGRRPQDLDDVGNISSGEEAASPARPRSSLETKPLPSPPRSTLQPIICTPLPGEFLLTTGTHKLESGVGIFVNLDGDVVGGTIEFGQYPINVIAFRQEQKNVLILAIYQTQQEAIVEVQSPNTPQCRIPISGASKAIGMSALHEEISITSPEVQDLLQMVPFAGEVTEDLSQQFGQGKTDILIWSESCLYALAPRPFLLRAERLLQNDAPHDALSFLLQHEPVSETDFLSTNYIRQKVGLLFLVEAVTPDPAQILVDSGLDPRITLSLLPQLRPFIHLGSGPLYVFAGIKAFLTTITKPPAIDNLKRYIMLWRQRKDFGSISDHQRVFRTLDSCLLYLLVHHASSRADLYALVDAGLDDFEQGIKILEDAKFLYVMSRLYQSRRMARQVLQTWKRIIEGEDDVGGGLVEGEAEVRRYLVNIKDTGLVEEYAIWLARRNPQLGVQVFTNNASRVRWQSSQAVALLRRAAPDAVKEYYEHLVFGKKEYQYATELVTYYLENVVQELQRSPSSRQMLVQTYELYRALESPKPTYREYITHNAIPQSWWQDRLRLLELLAGVHGAHSYDPTDLLLQLAPFQHELVPESIILQGRVGNHDDALRLLVHQLADYHTAITYCRLGGTSIAHPTHGHASAQPRIGPAQEISAGDGSLDHNETASPPRLFHLLLHEFLRIQDQATRVECTSTLLARNSEWFDIMTVLDIVPAAWSLETIQDFLVHFLRRLVHDQRETMVVKGLSGAENLQIACLVAEKSRLQVESVRQSDGRG